MIHCFNRRLWIIKGSPLTESCPGNNGTIEKCETPVIRPCKDRNVYCIGPPPIPKEGNETDLVSTIFVHSKCSKKLDIIFILNIISLRAKRSSFLDQLLQKKLLSKFDPEYSHSGLEKCSAHKTSILLPQT